ncbi:MAG: class IV adenylate cyclase [bacterium]|nr:class IV adenylate cyclase [Candidatus Sumerlaeota bacterium]
MPSNIEIKARAANLDELRAAVESLSGGSCETFHQEDIFFLCPAGRLKLRILGENAGELIFYTRPDTAEAKQSHYDIYRMSEPQQLRKILTAALGETVTVRKRRRVYMAGQTRIHLDEVEGLGTFMELEVVLRPGQEPEEGRAIAAELMAKLGVREADLVSCAYADLLQTRQG